MKVISLLETSPRVLYIDCVEEPENELEEVCSFFPILLLMFCKILKSVHSAFMEKSPGKIDIGLLNGLWL
jgi:hypothetical protein